MWLMWTSIRLMKLSLKIKILYSTVTKSWINFTCLLVMGSHGEKSCWYQNKIWLAIKVSPQKIHRESWKFSTLFSAEFFCSVYGRCTILFKLRTHSGKSWQNFQSARIFLAEWKTAFIVNFGQFSHIDLEFLLLTLNK